MCIPWVYMTSIDPFYVFPCPHILPDAVHPPPPLLWGSGCLYPLFIIPLFKGRRVWWIPVWFLLTYRHSWCLVLFPYQKFWHQKIQIFPIFLRWTYRLLIVLTGFMYGSRFVVWCMYEFFWPIFWLISFNVAPYVSMMYLSVDFYPNWFRFTILSFLNNTISLSLNFCIRFLSDVIVYYPIINRNNNTINPQSPVVRSCSFSSLITISCTTTLVYPLTPSVSFSLVVFLYKSIEHYF